jgi:hypothetical protein
MLTLNIYLPTTGIQHFVNLVFNILPLDNWAFGKLDFDIKS